jgi:uncharacterized protein (DUF433 family)
MEELIEINPKVMVGKPVIKGTRITVELILEKLAAGQTFEDILRSYPHLNRNQILGCLEYAYKSMSADFVFPIVHEAA